jgi:hypothetical protein
VDSQQRDRTDRRRRKARDHREARRVLSRRSRHGDRSRIARGFTLDLKLPFEPPPRGLPSGHEPDERLPNDRQIVAPLDVRPLVDDDAIEVSVAQMFNERRRNADHG